MSEKNPEKKEIKLIVNEKDKIKVEEISNQKIKNRKVIFISIVLVIAILFITGTILFFINIIPPKYYGTFVQYYYYGGKKYKSTYKISPLLIKSEYEYNSKGKKKTEKETYDYYKKGKDLIIKEKKGLSKKYVIVENDRLYIDSSKDISSLKKYELFYWNEKSDKADLYEIKNKADGFVSFLETTINLWARESIYKTNNIEVGKTPFYIYDSDEKNDETDLNTYEVKLKASGGDFSLYYDRKTKKLEQIYFWGSILSTKYDGVDSDSMNPDDLYDCRAMLFASMYILGNTDNIELNQDTDGDIKNYAKAISDLNYRTKIVEEYDNLFKNKIKDESLEGADTYLLSNDKYDIKYTNRIEISDFLVAGTISWNISLTN